MQTTTRRNRQTGTRVTLDCGDDLRYVLICEDHDRVCEFATKSEAQSFAASPIDWCEDCGTQFAQAHNA
jgi:hypothetical protein